MAEPGLKLKQLGYISHALDDYLGLNLVLFNRKVIKVSFSKFRDAEAKYTQETEVLNTS